MTDKDKIENLCSRDFDFNKEPDEFNEWGATSSSGGSILGAVLFGLCVISLVGLISCLLSGGL
jgi:hypothetical protein